MKKGKRLCLADGGVDFSNNTVDGLQKRLTAMQGMNAQNALGGQQPAPTVGQPQQQQPYRPMSGLENGIIQSNAIQNLSNTQRYQLENPTNSAYKIPRAGQSMAAPGSAADVSQMRTQNEIAKQMNGDIQQQKMDVYNKTGLRLAKGGIITEGTTPTADDVPVNLSKGEAVLPHKTVQALGGPEAVADMIEATNGKPTHRGLRGDGKFNSGGYVDDFGNWTSEVPKNSAQRNVLGQQLNSAYGSGNVSTVQSGANVDSMAATRANGGRGALNAEQMATNVEARAAAEKVASQEAAAAAKAARAPSAEAAAHQTAQAAQEARFAQAAQSGAQEATQAAGQTASRMNTLRSAINGENATTVGDLFKGAKEAAGKVNLGSKAANALRAGAPAAGIEGAVRGYNTTNAEYAKRLNIEEPTSELGGLGLRALGVLSDIGSSAINGAALIPNLIAHGLDTEKWYDYRKNFADVQAGASEKASAAKPTASTGANAPAVPTPEQAAATAAAEAEKAKTAAIAKAGNVAGQNRIPEAVTLADQKVADIYGDAVDKATGVSRSGNQGLRGMAQRLDTYAKNDDVRAMRNAREQYLGSGARFDKGSDGKIVITNSGDFDGSTKMPYRDANGNPTNVYEGSMEHRRGVADAQGISRQLANIQQMRVENDAFNPEITDPKVRGLAQAKIAEQLAQLKIAQQNAMTPYQKAQLALEDKKMAQSQSNSEREARKAEREEQNRTIKVLSGGDPVREAALTSAVAGYNDDPNLKPEQNAVAKANIMDADNQLDEAGRHWLSSERTWDGRSPRKWKKDTHTLWDWMRGIGSGDVYEDATTGQRIGAGQLARMSPYVEQSVLDNIRMQKEARK